MGKTASMQNFERTALITGSGQNIGRGIALRLAQEGYNVVLNGSKDRSKCVEVAKEIEKVGGRSLIAMGDIGKEVQALAIVAKAQRVFGQVDILVNNAAIRPSSPFLGTSKRDWDRVMDVNLNSVLWLSRACIPAMAAQNWGRIINFTGMNAQKGYPGKAAVTVSKHAVWGFTKSLSVEFGRQGITSNIISPGTFPSDNMVQDKISTLEKLRDCNPTGRLGHSGDIAGLVAYLCSDEGGFMNGQILQINGGVAVQF